MAIKAVGACEGFPAIRLPGDIRGAARYGLQRLNVRRLLALRAGLDLEGDALAFLQRLEAFGTDLRKAREQVVAIRIRCNEVKALSIVEPFDDTSFHIPVFLVDLSKSGHCPQAESHGHFTCGRAYLKPSALSYLAIEFQLCCYTGNGESTSSEFFIFT